jgi:hypothetical protein
MAQNLALQRAQSAHRAHTAAQQAQLLHAKHAWLVLINLEVVQVYAHHVQLANTETPYGIQ